MKKILAISGSLKPDATHIAILRYIGTLLSGQCLFTFYEGMRDLPHYSPYIDTDAPPSAIADLREILQASDAVIICTPEYAYGVPGSLKNLLDWTVTIINP
jgi:NAD(P)H-dependent FMN reductase